MGSREAAPALAAGRAETPSQAPERVKPEHCTGLACLALAAGTDTSVTACSRKRDQAPPGVCSARVASCQRDLLTSCTLLIGYAS